MGNLCAFLSCLFETKIAPMNTILKETGGWERMKKKKDREREGRKEGMQEIMLSFKCSLKIT